MDGELENQPWARFRLLAARIGSASVRWQVPGCTLWTLLVQMAALVTARVLICPSQVPSATTQWFSLCDTFPLPPSTFNRVVGVVGVATVTFAFPFLPLKDHVLVTETPLTKTTERRRFISTVAKTLFQFLLVTLLLFRAVGWQVTVRAVPIQLAASVSRFAAGACVLPSFG
mmetsp:Transcript_4742/g.11799  ORF Transcript_4742/g.11799 Transcript_4742/m.11799 type:complete len:172 (-) Transcript_4742:255-770(-)